jgi:hypothetical protein
MMFKSLTTIAVAAGLMVAGAAMNRADAMPLGDPSGVGSTIDELNFVEKAQVYYYRGRRYCWYNDAWRGPGWYQCGYAWRHGWGWGGPWGWHGWRHPHYRHWDRDWRYRRYWR